MPNQEKTQSILEAAIIGFEAQKEKLNNQIAELRQMLKGGSENQAEATKTASPKRGKMSAAGRKAIAEAQKKRWAALKGQKPTTVKTAGAATPKRKLSKAGRAAIVAALKKRWAAKKAAAGKA